MKTLDKKLQKIVDKYKKNLKDFIEKNKLDLEAFSDIEERISEKIANLKELSETNIKNILTEIWTPEEIFAEEVNIEPEPKWFWAKLKKKSESIIFLWTCYELWQKTGISANVYRIFFLFLIFIWAISWTSEIIWISMFWYFIWFLVLRTWIFKLFFSLILGAIFFMLLIPSVVLFGAYISNFHIENIYPFMEVSFLFPIGMAIWIFSLLVLWVFFIHFAFSRKTLWIKIFLTWTISFVIAITIWIAVLSDLYQKYLPVLNQKETFDFSFETKDIKSVDFVKWHYKDIIESTSKAFYIKPITKAMTKTNSIKMSPDDKIHVKITKNIYGSKEIVDKVKNYIKNINAKIENWLFLVDLDIDTENKYPVFMIALEIEEIQIPQKIFFNSFYYTIDFEKFSLKNLSNAKDMENFKDVIAKYCEKYYFENWEIFCEEENAKKILENYLKSGSKWKKHDEVISEICEWEINSELCQNKLFLRNFEKSLENNMTKKVQFEFDWKNYKATINTWKTEATSSWTQESWENKTEQK